MKKITISIVTGLAAVTVSAQVYVDEGAASEVLRGTLNNRSAGAIISNQRLNSAYDTLLIEQHLAVEAARRGLDERIDVQQDLIKSRRKILINALREEVSRTTEEPSEKELKRFYRENTSRFSVPEAYQIDAVQLDPEDKGNLRLAGSLVTGEPISDQNWKLVKGQPVASQDSGRWLTANEISPRIWDALPMMKYGAVRLFVIGDTRLLVRKGSHRESQLLPYEDVKERARVLVKRQMNDQAWQAYVMEVKEQILPELPIEEE